MSVKTISATSARSDLYNVIDSALTGHEPIQITGKRGNAVLLGEDDWRSIQETLHQLSIPGMRKSIVAGMGESVEECADSIEL